MGWSKFPGTEISVLAITTLSLLRFMHIVRNSYQLGGVMKSLTVLLGMMAIVTSLLMFPLAADIQGQTIKEITFVVG